MENLTEEYPKALKVVTTAAFTNDMGYSKKRMKEIRYNTAGLLRDIANSFEDGGIHDNNS